MEQQIRNGCRTFLASLIALAALALTTTPAWCGGLTNISARAYVGTEDQVLIPGFIVNQTQNFFFWVQGPSLDAVVDGALADPRMEIRDAETGALIAANDNWEDSLSADVIRDAGLNPHPNEPALVLNLAPGSYTMIVQGVAATTGIANGSIYDVSEIVSGDIFPGIWVGSGRSQAGDLPAFFLACLNVSLASDSLTVSNTGCGALQLDVATVQAEGGCDLSFLYDQGPDIPIVSNSFSLEDYTPPDRPGEVYTVTGTFQGSVVAGTIEGVDEDDPEGCSGTWSAIPIGAAAE